MSAPWSPAAEPLPYGAIRPPGTARAQLAVRVADHAVALSAMPDAAAHRLDGPNLDAVLAGGPDEWAAARQAIRRWLATFDVARPEELPGRLPDGCAWPLAAVEHELPFTPHDYVDFYASEQHARNVGKIFRPQQPDLPAAWLDIPIGYHGRAGTMQVSGRPVRRPHGIRRVDGAPEFGPSRFLDIEAEIGFVLGNPAAGPIDRRRADDHVFGLFVLNDWSARDIQAFEYVPLGPFLGKSFATSISPWVTPLAELHASRVAPPPRQRPLTAYLDDGDDPPCGFDLELVVELNGEVVSRAPFRTQYFTYAQMLAHMTVNGAGVTAGDMFASGTVSGATPDQFGSLLELTWNGERPLATAAGARPSLADGDSVAIRCSARRADGTTVDLGAVIATIVP